MIEYYVSYNFQNNKTSEYGFGWQTITTDKPINNGDAINRMSRFLEGTLQTSKSGDFTVVIMNFKKMTPWWKFWA